MSRTKGSKGSLLWIIIAIVAVGGVVGYWFLFASPTGTFNPCTTTNDWITVLEPEIRTGDRQSLCGVDIEYLGLFIGEDGQSIYYTFDFEGYGQTQRIQVNEGQTYQQKFNSEYSPTVIFNANRDPRSFQIIIDLF